MTWLGLIKLKLSEEKSKGKSPSIGDVTPLAKKEWVQIKEGKHPLYIQGKAQTFARKKKSDKKTRKADRSPSASSPSASASSASASSSADIQQLLAEIKLCGKCKKKVDKILKKKGMKGGSNGGCTSCGVMGGGGKGGGCGCGGDAPATV